jgi:hypothetical protein
MYYVSPAIYDWISALPPPSCWGAVDVSYDCPGVTLYAPFYKHSNGKVLIKKFVISKSVAKGVLCFQFDMSFYHKESENITFPCLLGRMSFNDWEDNKMTHILAVLINYAFKDVYRIGDTQLAKVLVDLDLAKSSEYKDVFNTAFLAARIRMFKEDYVIKITESYGFQFLENELENAARGIKFKFISALGDDCIDRLMSKVASIFTENNYKRTAEELLAEGNNPLVYSNSDIEGFWIVRIYAPVILMNVFAGHSKNLDWNHHGVAHHQMQANIQFRYTVKIFSYWIEVQVRIRNLRCDVIALLPEFSDERHFPSRLLLSIGPHFDQSNIRMFSLSQSSNVPPRCELRPESISHRYHSGFEFPEILKTLGGSCWKYEQSEERTNVGTLDWTLYSNSTGHEVPYTTPKVPSGAIGPWFENGYSRVSCSPFTKKGGVVFTEDDGYGHPITWTLKKDLQGKTLKWHVRVSIWLTYWPMKASCGSWQTIKHEFSQDLELKLVKSDFVTE